MMPAIPAEKSPVLAEPFKAPESKALSTTAGVHLNNEGAFVADRTSDAGVAVQAEGSVNAKGTFKAEEASTTPAINEQNVAHRFSKAADKYNSIASIQRVIAEQALANLPKALQGEALDIG